ncbi:hypothetical protein Godav_019381 [Gossypium davidsonii]|uniref:Uncharacterized protein n=2 Tax=Gossypium TaxID=3633 RepID=A0A7J8R0D1_GOSDV|nr:hypothetical protein [Gossypium davidsonii]MBA0641969.1 hypothetical protein [Gossypium klotzschianum]
MLLGLRLRLIQLSSLRHPHAQHVCSRRSMGCCCNSVHVLMH